MASSPRRRAAPTGLCLLRGAVPAVSKWGARGVVPLHVIPVPGWTAVLPAGESCASAPYDASLPMLAARRVPGRLRAALGFFVIDGKAVLSVQSRGFRSHTRYVVWEPESGVMRSPELTIARPEDLQRAARRPGTRVARELRDLLRTPGEDVTGLLTDVMQVLDLPGRELLAGGPPSSRAPGSVLVEPDRRTIAGFNAAAHDEIALRAELGLDP